MRRSVGGDRYDARSPRFAREAAPRDGPDTTGSPRWAIERIKRALRNRPEEFETRCSRSWPRRWNDAAYRNCTPVIDHDDSGYGSEHGELSSTIVYLNDEMGWSLERIGRSWIALRPTAACWQSKLPSTNGCTRRSWHARSYPLSRLLSAFWRT